MHGKVSSRVPHTSFSMMEQPLLTFGFRARRDGIDWRRFSALDVERVAREMDVQTLQDYLDSVTFCNLDSERCPHCRNPLDPVLLKVFRMSQLTTEYLLYSQEYLNAKAAEQEEKLVQLIEEQEHQRLEISKLQSKLQATRQESHNRKKMIASQQLLLQAGANNYHKCQLCDKCFMSYSFLQGHMERRHPEVTNADRQKKRQVEELEDEIKGLKSQQLLNQKKQEAEKEAEILRQKQEQEEQQRQAELERKHFEQWKENERRKFQQELSDLKQLFLKEFQGISNQSSSIEAKIKDLQTSSWQTSNLGTLQDDQEDRELWEREFKEEMERQKTKWKNKLKESRSKHIQDIKEFKKENERLLQSLSADQTSAFEMQKLQEKTRTLKSKIKEKDNLIRKQNEKIKTLSSRPVADVSKQSPVESQPIQVASSSVPAPASLLAAAPVVDKISSESEEDEMEDEEDGGPPVTLSSQQRLQQALMRDPDLIKKCRPFSLETLEERLEKLGVSKGTTGISKQSFKSLSAAIDTQRQMKPKQFQTIREELNQKVTEKARNLQGHAGSSVSAVKGKTKKQKSRQISTERKASQRTPARLIQSTGPQPAPRTIAVRMSGKKEGPQNSTTPFSSEDESVGDSAYVTSHGPKDSHPVKVLQSSPRKTQPAVTAANEEDDEDWSDTDISSEPASPSMGITKFPGSQSLSSTGSLVQTLTKSVERQLNNPGKKPIGGVKLIPAQSTTSPKSSTTAKPLQVIDVESDLELSPIEELTPEIPKPKESKMHGSTDSAASRVTSVWSSSASRGDGW
ncbi:cilium assembly protein DZIP1L isoform X2 [Erpetoichthys calabaricus]|nr:cilium assembly protein DZIP1L isoform X2 [Erpetoichthys calabaricus]XP_028681561.1 cilium assembly protein DZIP1L isoform X2 [Erpetoichthys calabaricus]XP_051779514.1 cilium assembly protein DZIP1L isoform X2 [Erpetoichthys calabaricus]XP_051779515.1 cilium assembly protein DZIP1L isoform X2 [Erpetoichthys calabaricus]